MATAKKCNTCKIRKEIEKSTEPACCIWYMDNVICGDQTPDDCPDYEKSLSIIERRTTGYHD